MNQKPSQSRLTFSRSHAVISRDRALVLVGTAMSAMGHPHYPSPASRLGRAAGGPGWGPLAGAPPGWLALASLPFWGGIWQADSTRQPVRPLRYSVAARGALLARNQ